MGFPALSFIEKNYILSTGIYAFNYSRCAKYTTYESIIKIFYNRRSNMFL